MLRRWLYCSLLLPVVLAQDTITSAPSSTASLITGTAISSGTPAAASPFPTANSTTATSSWLYLWVPELVACERVTLA